MVDNGIPLDKAELLSVLLEALLYGFSLLMFGATIWTLVFRRSTDRVNRKMFIVSLALFLCSTVHIVIHIIRVMDGFILYRAAYPKGPSSYFADITQWTFSGKNYVYITHMVIGDGVMLYRCYVVWQSKLVMILPVLLWCAAGVTGYLSCYNSQVSPHPGVFEGVVERWITSFWATSLSTNLVTTILLAGRLWYLDRRSAKFRSYQHSQFRPVLRTIIDAGAIYTLTLFAALMCFVARSNAQYVVLDMVTPIISITFYMIIIRVGLAARASRSTGIPLGNSVDQGSSVERRRRTQVHIMTFTESQVDHDQHTPTSPMGSDSGTSNPKDFKIDDFGERV